MPSTLLSELQRLKISCFSSGISLTPEAVEEITGSGRQPLTIHEYATTGGVTIELEQDIFVNAPFDEWFCAHPCVVLDAISAGSFIVSFEGEFYPVRRVLPLPGYLDVRDAKGRRVADCVMSHGDRIRLSPINGCAYDCLFCNLPADRYERRPADQLLAAFDVARHDHNLPPSHVLISGGAPGRRHRDYFEDVCCRVIEHSDLAVDLMITAWPDDCNFIERLVAHGAHGFSLNIELYDEESSRSYIARKHRLARPGIEASIRRAVELTGGNGRVRSLILVGLESLEDTLAGVEYLARLGCDPVLSPFRPAIRTRLEGASPPSREFLERAYLESRDIAERHGVRLGPRCIPCQHNTLTFPEERHAYFSWSERRGG